MVSKPPNFDPTRSLPPGDPRYVQRPGAPLELARMLMAGLGPVGLVGPAGSGKSTELARVGAELPKGWLAVSVAADRREDVRALTPERFRLGIAGDVAEVAMRAGVALSPPLRHVLWRGGVLPEEFAAPGEGAFGGGLEALVRAVLVEVRRSVPGLIVLVDGLERAGAHAENLVPSVVSMADQAHLAIVLPMALGYGPRSHEILGPTGRIVPVPAVVVDEDDEGWQEGREFLEQLALKRVRKIREIDEDLLDQAAAASGGIPRMFLQALSDAWRYAWLDRRAIPEEEDFVTAWRDQRASLRRLMVEGDREVLLHANGTDGLDVPEDRRIRLFSQGLLIEYHADGDEQPIVRPHPLLNEIVGLR